MYYLLLGDGRLLDFSRSFWYLIIKPCCPFETLLDMVLGCFFFRGGGSSQDFHWLVFFRKINTLLLLTLKNKSYIVLGNILLK